MTHVATPPTPPTAPSAAKRPKSPPAPSSSLKDCVADVRKLYDTYTRGSFSRAELASTLEVAADSGPTAQRIFTLKEYGLLSSEGDKFKVTEEFIRLKNASAGSSAFKRSAYHAIIRNKLFKELLDSFHSKLPPRTAVAMRLEQEKKFNQTRAEAIAAVLEDSLRYAGVLDASGNIVGPRDEGAEPNEGDPSTDSDSPNDTGRGGGSAKGAISTPPGALKLEIALKDNRRATVIYPSDLTAEEAEKVGNVLKAIVA